MIVITSKRAEDEMEAIGDWIAIDNPSRAISYVAELRAACHAIGDYPELYSLAIGRGTLRKKPFSPYLIFYRVRRRDVFIVSVRHGRRDNSRLR